MPTEYQRLVRILFLHKETSKMALYFSTQDMNLTLPFEEYSPCSQTASFMTLSLLSATPQMTSLFVAKLGHVPIFGPIITILKMPCTDRLKSGQLTQSLRRQIGLSYTKPDLLLELRWGELPFLQIPWILIGNMKSQQM